MRARQFWALFALGFVGVLSVIPVVSRMIARNPLPPAAPKIPFGALVALSLVQPTLLLAAGVAIGLRLTPRLGLRSYVADAAGNGAPIWPALRREVPLAVAIAVAQMAVVLSLELAFRPFMGDAWRRLEQEGDALGGTAAQLVSGLLYGGITEELIIRWGLMSLFAWLVWRFGGGQSDIAPRASVMWVAILASAILFGAGHLPAVSSLVPLTPVVVARTVLLNAIAGLAFGWLFWRRSLEAAMVAHASSHVVLFAVNLVAD
ncbi:MAG: CPBP family intramembrane glutamic endopeptidase [Gemmatimonadaceae bacterium]